MRFPMKDAAIEQLQSSVAVFGLTVSAKLCLKPERTGVCRKEIKVRKNK